MLQPLCFFNMLQPLCFCNILQQLCSCINYFNNSCASSICFNHCASAISFNSCAPSISFNCCAPALFLHCALILCYPSELCSCVILLLLFLFFLYYLLYDALCSSDFQHYSSQFDITVPTPALSFLLVHDPFYSCMIISTPASSFLPPHYLFYSCTVIVFSIPVISLLLLHYFPYSPIIPPSPLCLFSFLCILINKTTCHLNVCHRSITPDRKRLHYNKLILMLYSVCWFLCIFFVC